MILRKLKNLVGLGLIAALFCSTAMAQTPPHGETVLIKRAAQLREGPSESSRSMMALPLQSSVVRQGDKQGAWIKVSAPDSSQGWVHMFDVTSASANASPGNLGTSALRGITNFLNRGSVQPGSNVATSTLGIRGLGAESLNNSQPNVAAVAQAEALRVDAAQARQFAAGASLAVRAVEPLPVPVPDTPANHSQPNN